MDRAPPRRARVHIGDDEIRPCPHCGSYDRRIDATYPRPLEVMRMRDGAMHTGYRIKYFDCGGCGARLTVRVPMRGGSGPVPPVENPPFSLN